MFSLLRNVSAIGEIRITQIVISIVTNIENPSIPNAPARVE